MLKFANISDITHNITHARLAGPDIKSMCFNVTRYVYPNESKSDNLTENSCLTGEIVNFDFKITFTITKLYKVQMSMMLTRKNTELVITSATNGDGVKVLEFIDKCIKFGESIAFSTTSEVITKYESDLDNTKSTLYYQNHRSPRQ